MAHSNCTKTCNDKTLYMNILVVYLQQIWGIQAIVTQYFVFLFYWIAFWQQFASRLYNLPKSEEKCFEEKYSLAILSRSLPFFNR